MSACPVCGKPTPRFVSHPAKPGYAPGTHQYQKPGGWMLLFQIAIFGQAAWELFSFIRNGLLNGYSFFLNPRQLINVASMIFWVVVAVQLLRRQTVFLRNWYIANALSIAAAVYYLIKDLRLVGFDEIAEDGFAMFMVVVMLVFALAMTMVGFIIHHCYYTRSVRVRTYMGTDAYITRCPVIGKRIRPPKPAVPDQEPSLHGARHNHPASAEAPLHGGE